MGNLITGGVGFEDMGARKPSMDRARDLIDYRPVRDLDMIIRDVADYMSRTAMK